MDGRHHVLRTSHSLGGAQSFQYHDFYMFRAGDSRHAPIVPPGGDGAGHMGAVGVLLRTHGEHRRVIVEEIPAEIVVHIAVAVIVNAVTRDLAVVGPDGIPQIGMEDVHSCVDDGHHHVPVGLGGVVEFPGGGDVNVHPRCRVGGEHFIVPGTGGDGQAGVRSVGGGVVGGAAVGEAAADLH